MRARQLNKPAIVAHQLLHSMIEYPIPTRAEVADVADVVRQRADALMLSGWWCGGRGWGLEGSVTSSVRIVVGWLCSCVCVHELLAGCEHFY